MQTSQIGSKKDRKGKKEKNEIHGEQKKNKMAVEVKHISSLLR